MNYVARVALGLEPQPDYRADRSTLPMVEDRVYEYLLQYSPAFTAQVAHELDLNLNSARSALQKLKGKGLIINQKGKPKAVWLAKDGNKIVDRRKG